MSPLPSTGMSTCAASSAMAVPVGLTRVVLCGGPAVERDRRTAAVLGDLARLEERQVLVVDALAGLHRDRHRVRRSGRDRLVEDLAQQATLPRQYGSPALAGHLGDRTPEVQVDVLDAVLAAEDLGRPRDRRRVDAVQLDRSDRLVGVEDQHAQRGLVLLHEPSTGDHLADVEACSLLAAQRPVRRVRHARHRGEHDRRIHQMRTQLERRGHRTSLGVLGSLSALRAPRVCWQPPRYRLCQPGLRGDRR